MESNNQKVLALGKYIADLQRDYNAQKALLESLKVSTPDGPRPFEWRSRVDRIVQESPIREIASTQIHELRLAIGRSTNDSDLIGILHSHFVSEG